MIRNLGLIGHFDDTGFHTKYHHIVGLMRFFEKLLMQPTGVGLPKKFLWSFWPRLCFAQVGHSTFAYDAEKALLLAAKIDPTFNQKLKEFFNPVINHCSKLEGIKGNTDEDRQTNLEDWFDSMVKEFNWKRIYLWCAALKLKENRQALGILKGQEYDKDKRQAGFNEGLAFDILLNPKSEWTYRCDRINRLDYVVRDLSFSGRLSINLDVDRLLAQINDYDDPDWQLVDNLDYYLTHNLFATPEHQLESQIFRRSLADCLVNNKITIEKLFGLDTNEYFTDENLIKVLQNTKLSKNLFNSSDQKNWSSWHITAEIKKRKHPIETEFSLSNRKKLSAICKDHSEKSLIAFQDMLDKGIYVGMYHRGSEKCPTPSEFLQLCKKSVSEFYPRINVTDYHKVVSEGLSGRTIKCDLSPMIKQLSTVQPDDFSLFQKASEYICRKVDKGQKEETDFTILIGEIVQPLKTAEFSLPLRIMQATFLDPSKTEKLFNADIDQALATFWGHLVSWQDRYFLQSPAKCIIDVIKKVQEKLIQRILSSASTKDQDTEAYAFLESLIFPNSNVKFRLCLPNWTIINDETKEIENEYDVVSFTVSKDNIVEAWIWGCTTNQDIAAKRADDTTKIQKLKDSLGQRWAGGGGIRTVQNYVHKDNNFLCIEIDGNQERRDNH